MQTRHILFFVIIISFYVTFSVVNADEITLSASNVRIRDAGEEVENGIWKLWSHGNIGDCFQKTTSGKISVTVNMAGQPAFDELPLARLTVETPSGNKLFQKTFTVDSKDYKDYTFELEINEDTFVLQVGFLNDYYIEGGLGDKNTGWDRYLLINEIRINGAKRTDKLPSVKDITDPAIRKHRMGTLEIKTKPGTTVKIQQMSHEFSFGTVIDWSMFGDKFGWEDREMYFNILKSYFNSCVNQLYWHSTEATRGSLDFKMSDIRLQWCEENDFQSRGHCIFWGKKHLVQNWVQELNNESLRNAIANRARGLTSRYRGRITEYDLNNEMIFGTYYRDRLGKGIIADMARWAKEGDPDAVLYVNDYRILNGAWLDKYVQQIKDFLEQGVPIGGIGCQGHFRRPLYFTQIKHALDELSQFNLPIKITEFTINTTDKELQAKGLSDFYRVCFAHPSVEGVLIWGFWETTQYEPDAALWRKDWSATPAGEIYKNLVRNEWWTYWEGKVENEEGILKLPAFYGKYLIEANDESIKIEFTKKEGNKTISLGL